MDNPYSPAVKYGTIASGGSVTTNEIDLDGYTLVGFHMPGTIAGTAMTFQAGDYAGSYNPVYNSGGTRISIPYGNGYAISDVLSLAPLRNIKIETSGTQTAERVISVFLK